MSLCCPLLAALDAFKGQKRGTQTGDCQVAALREWLRLVSLSSVIVLRVSECCQCVIDFPAEGKSLPAGLH